VVVNKIDRPAARPEWVVDATYELFMDLGATDEQCEFPVVYASGVNGIAGGLVCVGGGGTGEQCEFPVVYASGVNGMLHKVCAGMSRGAPSSAGCSESAAAYP
jgi:predicted membrane GTPase involved in stress response